VDSLALLSALSGAVGITPDMPVAETRAGLAPDPITGS
jgi:hypothetical protein